MIDEENNYAFIDGQNFNLSIQHLGWKIDWKKFRVYLKEKYKQALIITSDGDFYSLVKHLYNSNKLKFVLSPTKNHCSVLLKTSAKEKIIFFDNLKKKLAYKNNKIKRKSTA